MSKKYTPVSCSFVDQIEIAATKGSEGEVIYLDEGKVCKAILTVQTWKTECGEEFLISTTGYKIRLDHVVSLHGTPGPASQKGGC